MSNYHESRPVNAQAMSATWTSQPIDCTSATYRMTLHIVSTSTGSPVGAYTIEGSNDHPHVEDDKVRATTTASWVALTTAATVLPAGSLTVAGAVNALVTVTSPPRYIRLVYTRTSGGTAGTATVYAFGSP